MDADTALSVIAESGVNPFPLESSGWLLSRWPLNGEGFPVTAAPVDIYPVDPSDPLWVELGGFRIMSDDSPRDVDNGRARVVFDQRLVDGEKPLTPHDSDVVWEVAAYALLICLLRQQATQDNRYAVLASTPAAAARAARARSKQYTDWADTAQSVLTMFGDGWAQELTPVETPNKHRKKVRSLW